MKVLARLFAALVVFVAITNLNSSASTLLCSAGPTSLVTGNNGYQTLYNCTIPANTLSLGGSLRLTTNVSSNVTSGNPFHTQVTLNGVLLLTSWDSTANQKAYWDLVIVNTGSSTGTAAGLVAFSLSSSSPLQANVSGLSWGTSQILQIQFSCGPSFKGQGITLRVEAN